VDAVGKTGSLERVFVSTLALEPNTLNPNTMSDAEFNLLCDNIEKMGMTDPILVRPLDAGRYRIVGGHHRWEVAKLLGFKDVPCTVITDPDFDEDQEKFQVVRMNTIRGHLSPDKFMQMYLSLSSKYADSIMAESFGFADEAEFKKLVSTVKKGLPKELQEGFEAASAELKTIDDLSKLLNHLFTTYGSTLPFGYMLIDFGGRDSIWLRMSSETRKAVLSVCKTCVDHKRTVDDILGGLIQMLAKGQLSQQFVQLIADAPEVQIPEGTTMPTQEILSGAIKQG